MYFISNKPYKWGNYISSVLCINFWHHFELCFSWVNRYFKNGFKHNLNTISRYSRCDLIFLFSNKCLTVNSSLHWNNFFSLLMKGKMQKTKISFILHATRFMCTHSTCIQLRWTITYFFATWQRRIQSWTSYGIWN